MSASPPPSAPQQGGHPTDTLSEGQPLPLDAALITSIVAVGCAAVILTLGAGFFASAKAALGVAMGGLLATLNLWLFAYLGRAILAGGPRRGFYLLLTALKLAALLGLVYGVLRSGLSNGLLLALGYGAMPIGITIGNLLRPQTLGGGIADPNLVGATPSEGIERSLKEPPDPSTVDHDQPPSESV